MTIEDFVRLFPDRAHAALAELDLDRIARLLDRAAHGEVGEILWHKLDTAKHAVEQELAGTKTMPDEALPAFLKKQAD